MRSVVEDLFVQFGQGISQVIVLDPPPTHFDGPIFLDVPRDRGGDVDLVIAGKSGQPWFENPQINNVPRETREQQLLWNQDWPFSE